MNNRIIVVWFIMFWVFGVSSLRANEGGYIVIVNAENAIEGLSKEELSKIFLKDKLKWDATGTKMFPIDLPVSNLMRRRFTKEVLGKEMQQIGAYWNKARAAGKKKPKVIKEESAVILKVGVFKGAIAYVKEDTSLSTQVKTINILP